MNMILSIFLCFALAFSGSAGLPTEPETATTWTLRNVTLYSGEDSITLNPEAHITTAVGAEKVSLQFNLEDDGKTLLPIAAEITPDALTFSLSSGGRAYTLSDADFLAILEADEEDLRAMKIFGELFTSYGALLGLVSSSDEQALAYSEAVTNALIETCGGEIVPVEIEFDGETLSAEQVQITMTYDSTFALLDALRSCGFEEMEKLMGAMLDFINLAEDTDYPDYATLAAEVYDEAYNEFAMPMTITAVETDDLVYGLLESDLAEEGVSMTIREEIVQRGEETSVETWMTLENADDVSANYWFSVQTTGPSYAPATVHADYDVTMETPVYSDGGDSAQIDTMNMFVTLDAVTEDELTNAECIMSFVTSGYGGNAYLTVAEQREEDGSITASVGIAVSDEDDEVAVTFDINRAEGDYVNPFDGVDTFYAIDENLFSNDSEELSPAEAAMFADAALMSVDVMQLSADESIQAIMALDVDIALDYDDYDDFYGNQLVDTLEEAAAIYEGTIPAYTAPEGYEITSITADPDNVDIEYISEESGYSGFSISYYNYLSSTQSYTFSGGKLLASDTCTVQLREYDPGDISSAEVTLPGGILADVYFYGGASLEEVEAILAGFDL